MTADLDHVRTDFEPELTKGQGLCEALASCEGHLQNGLVLFVTKRGVLSHVNLDFADSDEPVLIMPMFSGCLDLENILLQSCHQHEWARFLTLLDCAL